MGRTGIQHKTGGTERKRTGAEAGATPALVLALLVAALATTRPSVNAHGAGAGRVVATGSMSLGRSGHTATRLPGGRVLVAGGMARNGEFLAECELYHPATGKFSAAGKMSARRVTHTATLLPSGKVLLAGGIESRYQSAGRWAGRTLSSAELFDPVTGSFAPTGSMSVARSSHAAVLLPNGKVLVLGGSGGDERRELRAGAELYDPASGKFTSTGAMQTARIPHGAALLADGRVMVAGGTGPERRVLASVELYDAATGKFSAAGNMSVPRHKHAATPLADGRVLIAGGSDERDWNGQLATAELYDPVTRRLVPTGKMSAARFKIHAATLRLSDGGVLVAGGGAQVEVYDPASGTFRAVAGSLEEPWHFATATLLADGQVLIVGGYANNSEGTARAWLYQP